MSFLHFYGKSYENTAKNRLYPILSSFDVVFLTKTKGSNPKFFLIIDQFLDLKKYRGTTLDFARKNIIQIRYNVIKYYCKVIFY